MSPEIYELVHLNSQESSGLHSLNKAVIYFNISNSRLLRFLLERKIIKFVLFKFSDNLLHFNHVSTLINSSFRFFCRSCMFLCDKNKCVSSANRTLCRMLEQHIKSFIYKIN